MDRRTAVKTGRQTSIDTETHTHTEKNTHTHTHTHTGKRGGGDCDVRMEKKRP